MAPINAAIVTTRVTGAGIRATGRTKQYGMISILSEFEPKLGAASKFSGIRRLVQTN
jgi:hypothetical protein